MTMSIRPAVTAHAGRFNIRVREGKSWMRMEQGPERGEFEMGPFGVTVWGARPGTWTLIPWTNILAIEPTT